MNLNFVPLTYKDEFNRKIAYINLSRARFATVVLIIYLIPNILFDLLFYRRQWGNTPAYLNLFHIHVAGLALYSFMLFLCRMNEKKKLNLYNSLNYLFIIITLIMNEALSMNAQFIHGQISAYIISLFCIATMFLLTNFEIFIITFSSAATMIIGLLLINQENQKLFGNIVNSVSLIICVLLISRMCFFMYVNEFLVNKELENSVKMKDEFLSLVSHEFRTPLTVILSAVQTIERLYFKEMSDKPREYIGKIKQNSYRQLRLVNNLLDINRANAGRIKIDMKNEDVVFLTRDIVDSVAVYAEQKGVRLSFQTAMDKKSISIDEEKFERILLNLLSNAIKFTPRGKEITVRLAANTDWLVVDVIDEGIGIPEDKIKLIFERFGQVDSTLSRQAEGTGIGLSLVKAYVEAFGGNVKVSSEPGHGSTFTVELPLIEVVEEESKEPVDTIDEDRITKSTVIEFSDQRL